MMHFFSFPKFSGVLCFPIASPDNTRTPWAYFQYAIYEGLTDNFWDKNTKYGSDRLYLCKHLGDYLLDFVDGGK